METIAGGASHAPRRKSLPGEAMAIRIKSPCVSIALTIAAITTPKVSGEPDALVSASQLSKLIPVSVAIEKLLCLPGAAKCVPPRRQRPLAR